MPATTEPRRVPLAELEALHLEPGDLVLVSCPREASMEEAQAAFYAVRDAIPDHRALILHGDWHVGKLEHELASRAIRTLTMHASGRITVAEREALERLADALEACGAR